MCPEVGTGEPAGTTRCRLCQRVHIGSTSAQIVDVNRLGVMWGCHAAVDAMARGTIVNIASLSSLAARGRPRSTSPALASAWSGGTGQLGELVRWCRRSPRRSGSASWHRGGRGRAALGAAVEGEHQVGDLAPAIAAAAEVEHEIDTRSASWRRRSPPSKLGEQQPSLPVLWRELVPTSVPTFLWRRETPGYASKRSTYWNL
jgi:hypothetical protein